MRDTTRKFIWGKALSYDTSGTSTSTLTAIEGGGAIYRLYSTSDCGVNFDTTSVSDGTNFVLVAGVPEYIDGPKSGSFSAKGLVSSGTLYIACMGPS